MRRGLGLSAILAVIALVAAACGGGTASPSASASAAASPSASAFPATLTIMQGYVPGLNHLPDDLAPQYGAQFGVDIKSTTFTNVPDTVTAMGRGDIDIMINTPSTVISGLDRGLDLVMVGGGYYRSTAIILSPKLAVAAGDWTKLKSTVESSASAGKKLKIGAATSLSANWVECYFSMKQHGIDVATTLTPVNIPAFAEHPGALTRGDVDMLCSPEPFETQAQAAGGTFFASPFDTPAGETLGALVTTSAKLKDPTKKEALRRYMQAYNFAVNKVNTDKAFALQTAMRIMKTNDENLASKALANTKFKTGFNPTEVGAIANMHYQLKETQQDWSTKVSQWATDELVKDLK